MVGILDGYDRSRLIAVAPFFWNVAIIVVLVGLRASLPGRRDCARAIGVLVGTVVQLAIVLYDLRHTQYGLRRHERTFSSRIGAAFRDIDVRRVLLLILPVTISLGLINFNLVVDEQHRRLSRLRAGAGGDRQGVPDLHAAPGRVLRRGRGPFCSRPLARFAARGDLDGLRATMASGMRLVVLLLIPATAAILVLAGR